MTKFEQHKSLIVVALEKELPINIVDGWQVLYTGVGKVNAAIEFCKAAAGAKHPKTIINYGSAGSLIAGLSGIHEVTKFVQRDMDARALGFELGQTPFEDNIEIDLGRDGLTCGTGDSFVSDMPELQTDLVDMESYVLAKICKQLDLDFYCYKFISDNADEEAAVDWDRQLNFGALQFAHTILGI